MSGFPERIAHVDMDAFFVEVERQRRPEIAGKPVLVGGSGPRGVVASASYEARSRGAGSAMPMRRALQMCPDAIVVAPDHDAYREVSRAVFDVLEAIAPNVEALSVDEAFLDIGGLRLHYPDAAEVGERIRAEIRSSVGLPSSVGIATSKLVAKMASRDAKPDGLLLIPAGSEVRYLGPKPVGSLWGVGDATHARLDDLGVETIGDLASFPEETLRAKLGDALGSLLHALARGADDRSLGRPAKSRSISVEQTYDRDLGGLGECRTELLGQADRLAARVRRAGLVAGALTLKVRFEDFTTVTRSHTFSDPAVTAGELYATAVDLLERTDAGARPVRLLGLAASSLDPVEGPRQLPLEPSLWPELEEAVEAVRTRFGDAAIRRARLVGGEREEHSETKPPPSI